MNAICNSGVKWQLQRIPLAAIIVDPALQQRAAGTSQDIVADYAEALAHGKRTSSRKPRAFRTVRILTKSTPPRWL
jgi:hypothetical protein